MEELKKKYKKRLAFRDYRIEELQKQNARLEVSILVKEYFLIN
jgi:hypothetical protein